MKVRPWQIWWVDFDPQVGREQAGRRPAVTVASETHGQLSMQLTLVVPLTSRQRPLGWRVPIQHRALTKVSYALTEQITTVSFDRFMGDRPIGVLDVETIAELRSVLRAMVDF